MFLNILTTTFMANHLIENHSHIFCDTSFFYSSLIPSDSNYDIAQKWSHEMNQHQTICTTTWDIISETLTLLIARHSYSAAITFIEKVEPSLKKIEYGDELRQQAIKTFKKFNKDNQFSFCDCLSYQVIRDLLGNIPTLSFDEDFKKMGLTLLC